MYDESNKKDASVQRVTCEINRRFFAALDELVMRGDVRTIAEFAKSAGLNRTRYWEMSREFGVRPEPGFTSRYREVDIVALIYINMKYGVSLAYLLVGKGGMFEDKNTGVCSNSA